MEHMRQQQPTPPAHTQPISMTLVIAPEDERDPDPVAITDVSRQVVTDVQQDGYAVTPLYTGQRGGLELLYQVVTTVVQTVGADVWAERDTFAILGNLCTIFAAASPLVLHLLHGREKQPTQEHQHEVKVSIRINEAEIEVTSSDVANDERIARLAERFLKEHPTASVNPQSRVQVRGRVAKSKPRRRR